MLSYEIPYLNIHIIFVRKCINARIFLTSLNYTNQTNITEAFKLNNGFPQNKLNNELTIEINVMDQIIVRE